MASPAPGPPSEADSARTRVEPGQTLLVARKSSVLSIHLSLTAFELTSDARVLARIRLDARALSRPKSFIDLVFRMALAPADMGQRGSVDDFKARTEDELTMVKGDKLELIERDDGFDDGWYLGRLVRTGQTGLFPQGGGMLPNEVDITLADIHARLSLHELGARRESEGPPG